MSQTTTIARGIERAVKYALGGASYEDLHSLLAQVRAGRQDLAPILADALEERGMHHDSETLWHLRAGKPVYEHRTKSGRYAFRPWPKLTASDIRRRNREGGGNFFSPATMRFWGGRLESKVHQGQGGTYFVHSTDNFDRSGRLWKVGRFLTTDGRVVSYAPPADRPDEPEGLFNGEWFPEDFGSAEAAHAAAAHLAAHGRLPLPYRPERMARKGKPQRYNHGAFHAEMLSKPNDRLPHLVYADWLEENGFPHYGEIVRRSVEASQSLPDAPATMSHRVHRFDPGWSPGRPHVHVYIRSDGASLSVGFTKPAGRSANSVRTYHVVHTTPEDAHRLLTGLESEGISEATAARHHLENRHSHLPRPDRMKRGGKPARLARQVPMYSAEHLHPELRFTRLGAVLRQIASDDPDPTSEHLDPVISLARHAIDAAGPHDGPMDLLPLGVLRDYMVENPDHPLAKRFNWDRLPEKVALDRTVRAERHLHYGYYHFEQLSPQGVESITRVEAAHPWAGIRDIQESAKRVMRKHISGSGTSATGPYSNQWHSAANHPDNWYEDDVERYAKNKVSGVTNALRLLRSRNQQQTRAVAGQVLQSLGLVPATVRDAVSTGPAPVASVLASVPTGGDDDKGEAAAAYLGHLLQLPAVTAFHTKPDGPDAVHCFTLPHPPDTAANILAKFNLTRAAISPSGGGTEVVVHDPGTKLTAAVRQAASGQPVKSVRGTSVSFGHSQGHRADAGARKTYRDVMAAWEDKAGGKVQMRRGGKPVRYSHESFGKAMLKNRADTLPPLVYADWLEENGQTAHGEVVRRHLQERGNRGVAVNDYKPNIFVFNPARFPSGVVSADTWVGGGLRHADEMAVEVGYNHPVDSPDDGVPVRRVSHHVHLPAAEAHALLLRLHDEGVAGAREAAAEVRRLHPHIPRPERMARKPDPLTHRNLFPDEQEAVSKWQPGTADRFRAELALALAGRKGLLPTKREVKALATLGEPVKGSYADTGRAMTRLITTPGDAHRWVVLNAILSAQTPWVAHTEGATAVLALWNKIRGQYMKLGQEGRKDLLDRAFGTTHQPGGKGNQILDPSKPRMLGSLTQYGGQKAYAIKRFLAAHPVGDYLIDRGDIGKSQKTPNFGVAFFDPRGFPVDTHMTRATIPRELMDLVRSKPFVRGRLPDVAAALRAAQDKLNGDYNASLAYKLLGLHAADELGWEPRETQEAAWTGTLAVMLAKAHGTGNDPDAIMAFLPKDAVRDSWDMGTVLKRATMLHHLSDLGVGQKAVKGAAEYLTDSRPRPTGNVETSDLAALKSVAERLPAGVEPAARPLEEKLKMARRRKRASDSPAFVALVRLLLDAGGLTQGEGVERFARDGRPELYGKKVAVKLKELKPWLAALAIAPHDRVTRGAFSDWLEERGLHHDDLTLHHLQLHDGPVFAMRHPRSGKVVAMPGRQVTSLEGLREHMAANGITRPVHPDGLEDFEFFHGTGGIAVLHRSSDTDHYGVSLFTPDGRPLINESRRISDDGHQPYGDPRPRSVARRRAMRHAFGA